MKKKIILLFGLLFFLSILTACGSNSEVTNNTSNYNPTPTTTNNPTSDNPTSTHSSTEQEDTTEQYKIYLLAQNSGYTGTYEEWLESIRGDRIVIKVEDNKIMWKYSQEENYTTLFDLSIIKGETGEQGNGGVLFVARTEEDIDELVLDNLEGVDKNGEKLSDEELTTRVLNALQGSILNGKLDKLREEYLTQDEYDEKLNAVPSEIEPDVKYFIIEEE